MKTILLFITLFFLSCDDETGGYEKVDYFIVQGISIDSYGTCRYTLTNDYINYKGISRTWTENIVFTNPIGKFNVGDTVVFAKSPERSYQLQVIHGRDRDSTNDSVQLWDNNRIVGTFKLNYDADPVSTLILEDNK